MTTLYTSASRDFHRRSTDDLGLSKALTLLAQEFTVDSTLGIPSSVRDGCFSRVGSRWVYSGGIAGTTGQAADTALGVAAFLVKPRVSRTTTTVYSPLRNRSVKHSATSVSYKLAKLSTY